MGWMTAVRGARVRQWVVWLLVLAGTTGLLLAVRGRLDKTHVALAYLLVVLGGSGAGGRWVGIALSALGFLCLNYFFLPPLRTLAIRDPLDWLVLAAFLLTGIVAAQLLSRAQERAEVARQRTHEVQRLAALGAETLNVGRAEDALVAVATVIRSALAVACCEILVPLDGTLRVAARAAEGGTDGGPSVGDDSDDLAAWVMARGAPAAHYADGHEWRGTQSATLALPGDELAVPDHVGGDQRLLLLPLSVRDRTVGVLRLAHDAPIRLDPAARQFLAALSYYAALGVERVRLTAAAERAEAFRKADELKSSLIATVSHDLRTPLTTIKALAHRLASTGEEDALSIEEEADRLNRFVADLLDLSRLSAGSLPLRVELNPVDDLIGAALDRVRGTLGEREVRVRRTDGRELEEPLLFGRFDLVQSLRVMINLLENAAKYSPADAPIEILVGHDGDRLGITVADRGSGVPEGEESLIFEPFYRPEGVPPDVGGAGLGLAIARRIAEAQGGTLGFARRAGGGSEFRLELPAATARQLAEIDELFIPDPP